MGDTIQVIIANIIILGIIIRFLILHLDKMKKLTRVATYMIIAGGVSNLFDRLIRGFVIDYINIDDIFSFPVFNVADIYVVIGWILLIVMTVVYSYNKESKGKTK